MTRGYECPKCGAVVIERQGYSILLKTLRTVNVYHVERLSPCFQLIKGPMLPENVLNLYEAI